MDISTSRSEFLPRTRNCSCKLDVSAHENSILYILKCRFPFPLLRTLGALLIASR